jgi:serine/threonine protein kinase
MDENLSCVVSVKETFAETKEQRRAFMRQAELRANLNHPALPRVTDHFTFNNGQFLVMQFVPGNDLAELLTLRERRFPAAKVLEWANQLLDALEELHPYQPPIIHRDIKPSNLKLNRRGKMVLLDFGIAKGAAVQMSTLTPSVRSEGYFLVHTPPTYQTDGDFSD